MTNVITVPKIGSIIQDDSKEHRPQEILTQFDGWVPFCCDHCSLDRKEITFDICPMCGADYTIDTDELVYGR